MLDQSGGNHTISARSKPYRDSLDPDYFPPCAEGVVECRAKSAIKPYFRCTRGLAHKGDHAAHGNEGDFELTDPPMYAKWGRKKK